MSGWTKDTEGNSVYLVDLECENCHKTFEATRRDAKFCSANCRKRSQRKISGVEQLANDIISLVGRLNDMAAHDNKDLRQKWKAQKELKRVRDEISTIR